MQTAHRPWAPPAGPWIMAQTWSDLLFAHWPVPVSCLEPLLPKGLALDTFEGQAWVAVVPFAMSGVRARFLPAFPGLSAFPELNVRTYVSAQGKPGVFFFSLDAANPVAVAVARRWFHLPYFNAKMGIQRQGGWVEYSSSRTHKHAAPAAFGARYRPVSEPFKAAPGTLEHWLTERYCLYAASPEGRLFRAEIHHDPWPLQHAEAEVAANTMARAAGIDLPVTSPHLLFARRLDVIVWAPERILSHSCPNVS